MMPPVTCSLYFYKEREPVIPTIVIDKTAVVRTKTAESNTGDMHRTNIEVGHATFATTIFAY